MAEYHLSTIWRIEAPLQRVYDAVTDSQRWPEWWPGVDLVDEIVRGDETGIGNVRRYVWKGRLPYRIRFDARTVLIEPARFVEAMVNGDLEGTGRWIFRHDDGITIVRHEWNVRTTRYWMNLAAPIARPFFTGNHHWLMMQGAHGVASLLEARLLEVVQIREEKKLDGLRPSSHRLAIFNPLAAGLAGIAAGGAATAAQMLAWRIAGYPPVDMLLRDSRLAAAIVLGPDVLPPPIDFDWKIMLSASAVHAALSVAYGLAITAWTAKLRPLPGLTAATLFGLALFTLNMFGMTLLFPWFTANRDWMTVIAHLVFGASVLPFYRFLSALRKCKQRKKSAA